MNKNLKKTLYLSLALITLGGVGAGATNSVQARSTKSRVAVRYRKPHMRHSKRHAIRRTRRNKRTRRHRSRRATASMMKRTRRIRRRNARITKRNRRTKANISRKRAQKAQNKRYYKIGYQDAYNFRHTDPDTSHATYYHISLGHNPAYRKGWYKADPITHYPGIGNIDDMTHLDHGLNGIMSFLAGNEWNNPSSVYYSPSNNKSSWKWIHAHVVE